MSKVRKEIDNEMAIIIRKVQKQENSKKGIKCTFPKASKILAKKIRGSV